MDILTRSMKRELDQTPTTRSGKKRIAPSPTKTTPIKKLRSKPIKMCLHCQEAVELARLQGKECYCFVTFENVHEGSELLNLAIAAEQKQVEELKKLLEEREALQRYLNPAD